MRDQGGDGRAVSPVIGVILMVAITVILAALIGTLALGLGEETGQSGPTVSASTDTFEADGSPGQVVRMTHENGDSIDVSTIEIVVNLEATGASGRIVGLPVNGDELESANVEGDDIFDRSPVNPQTRGAISSASPDTDGEWSSGDFIRFRIKQSDDSYDIAPGDEVTVRIIHTESGSILVDETLVAQ